MADNTYMLEQLQQEYFKQLAVEAPQQVIEGFDFFLDTLTSVTRFEVIDSSGRVAVIKQKDMELSLQDDNRTLKVFFK